MFSASRLVGRPLAGLAIALAVAVAGGAAAAEPGEDVARGRDLVQRNCGVCHAVSVRDLSPNPAAPAFRDLNARYPVEDLAEALAEGILTGHPQMPEFSFPPDDVNAIIHYLESIQTRRGAGRPTAPPRGG